VCSRLPALAVLTEASELVWCYARGVLWVAGGEHVLGAQVSVAVT
jgi:hypothetical protein